MTTKKQLWHLISFRIHWVRTSFFASSAAGKGKYFYKHVTSALRCMPLLTNTIPIAETVGTSSITTLTRNNLIWMIKSLKENRSICITRSGCLIGWFTVIHFDRLGPLIFPSTTKIIHPRLKQPRDNLTEHLHVKESSLVFTLSGNVVHSFLIKSLGEIMEWIQIQ